jgi:hypothetical protein
VCCVDHPAGCFCRCHPIALGVFLVARGAMREIRASNQSVERRREEWRAGGCVGPEPGKEYKEYWGDSGGW